MIILGLVGRVGAGKSSVARLLVEQGGVVIDADRLAHEVLEDPEAVAAIVSRFGPAVLDAAGSVRRPRLAEQVFGPSPAHEAALSDLEAIVHPRVRRRIQSRLEAMQAADAARPAVVVLDVPLLMQAGWDRLCDRLIVVECDDRVRQERLDRRGWPALQREARERAWERGYRPPPPEKTLVVDATGDPSYTAAQVGRILEELHRS